MVRAMGKKVTVDGKEIDIYGGSIHYFRVHPARVVFVPVQHVFRHAGPDGEVHGDVYFRQRLFHFFPFLSVRVSKYKDSFKKKDTSAPFFCAGQAIFPHGFSGFPT